MGHEDTLTERRVVRVSGAVGEHFATFAWLSFCRQERDEHGKTCKLTNVEEKRLQQYKVQYRTANVERGWVKEYKWRHFALSGDAKDFATQTVGTWLLAAKSDCTRHDDWQFGVEILRCRIRTLKLLNVFHRSSTTDASYRAKKKKIILRLRRERSKICIVHW